MKLKAYCISKKEQYEIKQRRKKLKRTDFTIISNNCWGTFMYQKYGLQYQTPTVGLFLLGHDFVKLAGNYEYYFSLPLQFISWQDSAFSKIAREGAPDDYPVARLGDIEIYFMHYKSEEEAAEKWNRRMERIHPDHMLFKLSQREGCSKEDVEAFMKLPLQHKVCFAYDEVPGTIHIPEFETLIGDETPLIQTYFDELDLLNSL